MEKTKFKILPAIKETVEDYAGLEKAIEEQLLKGLYLPLIKACKLDWVKLTNESDPVKDALLSGRIGFHYGRFSGRFNAQTSKRLRELGAKWDKKTNTYQIHLNDLPDDIRSTITLSIGNFQKTLTKLSDALSKVLPEEISEKVNSAKFFDTALWKLDKKVDKTLNKITVLPKLTPERRKKIADEWQENLQKYIKGWTEEAIIKLRKEVEAHVMKGGRFEELAKAIEKSYGVTTRKAKFLARQETNLLMTKFKETRYTEAGADEYIWGTVAGSPKHPVRPSHKALKGKTFRWDDPPITTMPGEPQRRNNPGEDFNCRCFAKPIVRF